MRSNRLVWAALWWGCGSACSFSVSGVSGTPDADEVRVADAEALGGDAVRDGSVLADDGKSAEPSDGGPVGDAILSDGDLAVVDAAPAMGDAASSADAAPIEPGACGPGATLTTLTPGESVIGSNVAKPNNLTSNGCGGSGAGEQVFTLTVDELSDVTLTTQSTLTTLTTVLYVRTECANARSELGCANSSQKSQLTLTNVAPGTYYVVVDGSMGQTGTFQLKATIKPVIPAGQPCDPKGVTNRCEAGSFCVDTGSGPVCTAAECDSLATVLSLGTTQTVNGQTSGQTSLYEPSCASTSTGPERLYAADVQDANGADLVVDLSSTSELDAIVEVTSNCGDAKTSESCNDVAGAQRGEVAVVPNAPDGRHYVIVDGWNGTQGSYRLRAWLRPLVQKDAGCSPTLEDNRCVGQDVFCVDRSNNGQPHCSALSVVSDGGQNASVCTTPDGPFHDDFAYQGGISGDGDVDVIALTPLNDSHLFVMVTDDQGGCAVDTRAQLLSGDCDAPSVRLSDDDSGLGSCPRLSTAGRIDALKGGDTYWLRISRSSSQGTGTYTLIVDFRASR